jgi:ubiquinone/menaquinone biosynthesis C-methylase UbiE
MNFTDADWKEWGERDPYFAVVTHDQFRKDRFAENTSEFFETGERDVELAIVQANRSGAPIKTSRALDFACGVGRLLAPLAGRFDEVVGLDISEGMMREARKNASSLGLDNVSIRNSDDDLSHADGQFDLVLSKIALQHIPVVRGMKILQRLLSRVSAGGAAVLDFSVHVDRPVWKELQYYKYRAMRLVRGKDQVDPPMKMHSYHLQEVIGEFDRFGMKNISIDMHKHFGLVFVATISGRKP